MEQVRARMADPQSDIDAQRRSNEINRRLQRLYVNEIGLALQNEKRPGKKFIWLRKLGDVLGQATKGVVPCKDGCNHCCNMATLISLQEAREIERATGRKMTMPAMNVLTRVDVETEREQYHGVRCTLLGDDGRCTIYEHRPWSCRVHYVLDKDPLLCQIMPKGETVIAPHYNTANFNMMYLLAHEGDPLDIQMADIREFFPGGEHDLPRK